jgi:hypothetical protein
MQTFLKLTLKKNSSLAVMRDYGDVSAGASKLLSQRKPRVGPHKEEFESTPSCNGWRGKFKKTRCAVAGSEQNGVVIVSFTRRLAGAWAQPLQFMSAPAADGHCAGNSPSPLCPILAATFRPGHFLSDIPNSLVGLVWFEGF